LDFGCGPGFLIKHLLQQFEGESKEIFGADISEDSLATLNMRYGGSEMFKGGFNPEKLVEEKRKFEAVLLVETIEHLDDATLDGVLCQVRNLLSPGGLLIITTPNNENLDESLVFCPACKHTFHRWQHMRSWNAKSLTKFLQENGFARIRAKTLDFSVSWKQKPMHTLKFFLKSLLGRKHPHLMCVAFKDE
jgi:2-polyprenyl-3-methyl-5-hydroxy-6-metoxy-1,4-benzoquinol methylase